MLLFLWFYNFLMYWIIVRMHCIEVYTVLSSLLSPLSLTYSFSYLNMRFNASWIYMILVIWYLYTELIVTIYLILESNCIVLLILSYYTVYIICILYTDGWMTEIQAHTDHIINNKNTNTWFHACITSQTWIMNK